MKPVGLGPRLAAAFVDGLILALASGMMVYFFHRYGFYDPNVPASPSTRLVDALSGHLLPALYCILGWVYWAATPGKRLLGCRVVDAASLRPVGWKQALLRFLGYYVSLLCLGLGFLWILWDKRRQGFHDKIANTLVVTEPSDAERLLKAGLPREFTRHG